MKNFHKWLSVGTAYIFAVILLRIAVSIEPDKGKFGWLLILFCIYSAFASFAWKRSGFDLAKMFRRKQPQESDFRRRYRMEVAEKMDDIKLKTALDVLSTEKHRRHLA